MWREEDRSNSSNGDAGIAAGKGPPVIPRYDRDALVHTEFATARLPQRARLLDGRPRVPDRHQGSRAVSILALDAGSAGSRSALVSAGSGLRQAIARTAGGVLGLLSRGGPKRAADRLAAARPTWASAGLQRAALSGRVRDTDRLLHWRLCAAGCSASALSLFFCQSGSAKMRAGLETWRTDGPCGLMVSCVQRGSVQKRPPQHPRARPFRAGSRGASVDVRRPDSCRATSIGGWEAAVQQRW